MNFVCVLSETRIVDIFAAMAMVVQPPPLPASSPSTIAAAAPSWLQAQLHYLRTHSPIPFKVCRGLLFASMFLTSCLIGDRGSIKDIFLTTQLFLVAVEDSEVEILNFFLFSPDLLGLGSADGALGLGVCSPSQLVTCLCYVESRRALCDSFDCT